MLVPARDPLCKYFLGFLMRLCSECGLDMDLVGLRHRCVPKPRAPVITEVITKPAQEVITERVITEGKRRGRRPLGDRAMTGYERLKRHRAKRRGERMRDGSDWGAGPGFLAIWAVGSDPAADGGAVSGAVFVRGGMAGCI